MSNQNSNQNLTHTYVQLQSTNVASFSSYVYFDIALTGHVVHDVILQISTGPITGISGGSLASTFPHLSTAYKWFTQCTITNGNNTLSQFDSQSNYLMNQLYTSNEDAVFLNTGAGLFDNAAARYTMSNTSTTWMVPIKEFFAQCRPEILNQNSTIRVAILMDSLANILNQGTLTGTGSVVINSMSLLIKVTKYDNQLTSLKLNQLMKQPLMKTYNTTNYQPYTIATGTTQSILSLSNFVNQQIQFIYFVIKPVANTKNDTILFSNNILNYSLVSSSGENINGGSAILPSQSLLVYNRLNTLGNFTSNSVYGNVFTVFYSSDSISTISNQGGIYGSRTFNGAESIVINYTSALAQPFQLDIYASCTSVYKQHQNASIIKLIV